MDKSVSIKTLMITEIISVSVDTPLLEANDILLKHGFAGLPVIDEQNILLGMFTKFDLSTKGSLLHLPTLLKLFKEFSIYKKDRGLLWKDVTAMLSIQAGDVMNTKPIVLNQEASLQDAIRLFSERRRVDPLPIIDHEGKLVGIISRYDLIRFLGGLASSVNFRDAAPYTPSAVDQTIDNFLHNFEKQFILVSKHRTLHWLLISTMFAIIGSVVTLAWVVQVNYVP
jgi:CBS domain-containing protein